MMMGSPANADMKHDFSSGDWNNNVQLIPIQLCNSDIAALIGVQVPIASPETVAGPCINGPVQD
ncbi:MAG: hypothetical protein GEV11_08305 [Streptosporangiales bacterium]|nr:hypothetical protein [Streptosporangiales bacterium]